MVLVGGWLAIHSGASLHARAPRMKPVLVSIQADPVGPALARSMTAMPGQTPWYVARIGAPEFSSIRLRAASSTTGAPPAACLTAATAASGKSPSSAMPVTLAASARRAVSAASSPGTTTARVASPRFAAAAANSAVAGRTSRQLTGPPASRSSEAASDHGQRAGTQSAGLDARPGEHHNARQARTLTQRSPRIRIYLLLYDNGALYRRVYSCLEAPRLFRHPHRLESPRSPAASGGGLLHRGRRPGDLVERPGSLRGHPEGSRR